MRSAPAPEPRLVHLGLLLVLVLLALVLLLVAPGAAHAAVAAPERVTAISPGSSSSKGVNSSCPAGKRVLGAAGRTNDGSGQVVLDDLAPNAALTGATAYGAEDGNGYSDPWVAISEPICATPPASLELVTASSPKDSSSKGVTATCPSGKRVVGTGADLNGAAGQVVLDDIAPNTTLTAVTAFAAEDGNGYAPTWTLRAFAVCANKPAGLQRVASTSASASDGSGKFQSAICPAGKDLLGVGGALNGGAGQVVIDEFNPRSDLSGADVFAKEDEDAKRPTGA